MSEPNMFAREGDSVMVRAIVVDAHWRDKRLYKVKIITQDGGKEFYVKDRELREPEQA